MTSVKSRILHFQQIDAAAGSTPSPDKNYSGNNNNNNNISSFNQAKDPTSGSSSSNESINRANNNNNNNSSLCHNNMNKNSGIMVHNTSSSGVSGENDKITSAKQKCTSSTTKRIVTSTKTTVVSNQHNGTVKSLPNNNKMEEKVVHSSSGRSSNANNNVSTTYLNGNSVVSKPSRKIVGKNESCVLDGGKRSPEMKPQLPPKSGIPVTNTVNLRRTTAARLNPSAGSVSTNTAFGGFHGSNGRFYDSMGWKQKFEESEKKRNHIVSLAQKATRDYEELRRRYQELHNGHEKLALRYDGAMHQLDNLQKASEKVYEEYHALRKKYESENSAKVEALSRVDQYNRENRQLKRASALMMQQINDPSFLSENPWEQMDEETEQDKEIIYLREKIEILEDKIQGLERDLERTRLAEFETQESVMMINDSVQDAKEENRGLKRQLKSMEKENFDLKNQLQDSIRELDDLKGRYELDLEKLQLAEAELKKVSAEKQVMQRQSLVFMSDAAADGKLMDALNQIGDLQMAVEEQKGAYENQIQDLNFRLSEKECEAETSQMQMEVKIKSLEEQIEALKRRAELAERKLEEAPVSSEIVQENSCSNNSAPPPPPPPPMMGAPGCLAPPPPPLPNEGGLSSSLNAAKNTLRRPSQVKNGGDGEAALGACANGKPVVPADPQYDDMISQIKKGIKLRRADQRPTPNKNVKTEPIGAGAEAVEEMRSILNNLKKRRS